MDLYLIRHAWAAQRGERQWPDDTQRPLTDEGKQRFARVVAKLVERECAPGIIATSPMVRCRQTAEILRSALRSAPDVAALDALLPGSDLESLLQWTVRESRRHGQIAWVGHAPDVDRLAAELIGGPGGFIRFAKGSVAAIGFEGSPAVGQGELRWLVTAKVLGC